MKNPPSKVAYLSKIGEILVHPLLPKAARSALTAKLYTPSTLNIDLINWHIQLNVCAENVKSWFKSWVFPFTFQAYTAIPYREITG